MQRSTAINLVKIATIAATGLAFWQFGLLGALTIQAGTTTYGFYVLKNYGRSSHMLPALGAGAIASALSLVALAIAAPKFFVANLVVGLSLIGLKKYKYNDLNLNILAIPLAAPSLYYAPAASLIAGANYYLAEAAKTQYDNATKNEP